MTQKLDLLMKSITEFLADPVPPNPEGGWTKVSEKDRKRFLKIIEEIRDLKWGGDEDDDATLEINISDLSYGPSNWAPQAPYMFELEKHEQRTGISARELLRRYNITAKFHAATAQQMMEMIPQYTERVIQHEVEMRDLNRWQSKPPEKDFANVLMVGHHPNGRPFEAFGVYRAAKDDKPAHWVIFGTTDATRDREIPLEWVVRWRPFQAPDLSEQRS